MSWWTDVSGPRRFIEEACLCTEARDSVMLSVPDELPFRDDFHGALADGLAARFDGTRPHEVYLSGKTIEEYFMVNFCRDSVRCTFRPKPGYTAADFLAADQTSSMHDKCFLIYIDDAESCAKWQKFISAYIKASGTRKKSAVFVLVCGESARGRQLKGFQRVDYSDFATRFDTYVYCAVLASDIQEHHMIKTYLAELAASVTKDNAELAETAILNHNEFLQDPVGFAYNSLGSSDDENELFRRIWEAQLKLVFPYTEKYRYKFIKKHEKEIEMNLPLRNPIGDDYVRTEDVELGALLFLAKTLKIQLDAEEFGELLRFKDARDDMAHLNVMPIGRIQALLD